MRVRSSTEWETTMGRTLFTLALVLVFSSLAFGQAGSDELRSTDTSKAQIYYITLDGKPAA